MFDKLLITMIAATLLTSGCSIVQSAVGDIEEPSYQVSMQAQADNIEVRNYEPMLVAQVTIEGERDQAINNGFRLLADYIFGNNSVSSDIAMTAPVQQHASQSIEMTAPVQQQADNGKWLVSFVMPSQYSINSIPKPNNDRVSIIEQPARQYAVIRFSGTASESNLSEHYDKLSTFLTSKKLQPIGEAKYAYYNPPWTLPFMRRNEIMYQVKTPLVTASR